MTPPVKHVSVQRAEVARAHALTSLPVIGRFGDVSALFSSRVVLVGLMLVVSGADYVTGIDISFWMLTQLVPIGLATWSCGKRFGAFIALAATVFSSAMFLRGHPFGVAALTNLVGVLGTYLVFVWTFDLLHRYVEREQQQRRIAIEQLRHADRLNVIGALAAGVAHELGTPLNVISGTAELLESAARPHPKVQELCGVIISQTDKINAIIRHLLDFGRRGGTSRTVVDLNHVAKATVDLLAATGQKSKVTIAFSAANVPIRTRANSSEIEQVLSNLVLNGIQAMPRGGMLRVHTSIETRPDASSLACVTVQDGGTGISEADLPRIFDPFFTTKGVGQGTGLGLSVSHGIVQDHGGVIDVRSAVGGTTFVVLLPLVI